MQSAEGTAMQSGQGMMQPAQAEMMQPVHTQVMSQGGHLYMQTNETHNVVIHYLRSPDGRLSEVERISTGGAGSGVYKPTSGEASAPNAFEGAKSVILTPDLRFLFATNGGDNSVSSFVVGPDGKLNLVDVKRTGNIEGFQRIPGKSGTAKALAYAASTGTLYVLHAFGPNQVRLMSVDPDGHLALRPECYQTSPPGKPRNMSTMAALSPDEKFLLVGTTFDEPAYANPDGSPILWARREDGTPYLTASNAPDPDGLIVFKVGPHGTLSEPSFQDGGGGSPWFHLFLKHRPDHFLIGYAVADGVALATIDEDGRVTTSPVAVENTFRGKPSELCWLSITPDEKLVFGTNFGYGYLTSFRIEGNVVSVAKDPACPPVSGDGTWRALNGTVGGGPSDSWICPEGTCLYQIYGNASKLIGYSIHPDGSLEEITSVAIPYNSPQGLAGF